MDCQIERPIMPKSPEEIKADAINRQLMAEHMICWCCLELPGECRCWAPDREPQA